MRLRMADYALAACGLALFALTCGGVLIPRPVIGVYGIGYGAALDQFVALTAVQGVIYLAAVAIVLRSRAENSLRLILTIALLLRMPALVTAPFLSNDIFRYIWDGWVQGAGINPYRYVPADPHLALLRDAAVFPLINRAGYAHTIYPPAAEFCFAAASRITALLHIPAVLGMKLFMFGCEAAGVFGVLRLLEFCRLPRSRVLIYAWSPLPVWEFGNNGHVDAIAIPLVAFALLFAVLARPGRADAALAAAALTKFLPVLLAPAVWRRWDWKFAGIFVAAIGLLYLPYLSVGWRVFGFLGGYGAEEGMDNGTGIFLLAALGALVPLPAYATKIYFVALACVLLALGAMALAGPRSPKIICRNAALLAGAGMLGLSPHYPWYYAWLLIPACVLPCSSLLYLTSFSFLLYLNPTHTKLLWPAVLYLPFIAFAVRDIFAARAISLTGLNLAEGRKI